jgi:hypothetical protein
VGEVVSKRLDSDSGCGVQDRYKDEGRSAAWLGLLRLEGWRRDTKGEEDMKLGAPHETGRGWIGGRRRILVYTRLELDHRSHEREDSSPRNKLDLSGSVVNYDELRVLPMDDTTLSNYRVPDGDLLIGPT